MSTASLPRWFTPRARRLTAAIIEATIDARGHDALEPLLGEVKGLRALNAVVGGPARLADALPMIRSALELERLDVSLESDDIVRVGERRFSLGGEGAELIALGPQGRPGLDGTAPDGGKVVALRPRPEVALVDIRRLTGALHTARGHLPESLSVLSTYGGLGARALFALSLVAELVCEGVPRRDPQRLRFALGGLDGEPYPVPARAYDLALQTMEALLHQRGSALGRVDALWALHRTTCALAERVTPGASDRMRKRERKRSRDLLTFDRSGPVGHEEAVPKLKRRPAASAQRRADRWTPPPPPDFEPPVLDRQGNLFAP